MTKLTLQEELIELRHNNLELIEALRTIEIWFGAFPPSGHFNEDGTEMSYGAAFGSNGERDYMRDIARVVLAKHAQKAPT